MNTYIRRSDQAGTNVYPFTGRTIGVVPTYQTGSPTDTRDFKTVSWQVMVSDKGAATRLKVRSLWSSRLDPELPIIGDLKDFAVQPAEFIEDGVGAELDFEAEYDISGKTAPFYIIFTLPVAGPWAAVALTSNAVDLITDHVEVWRG